MLQSLEQLEEDGKQAAFEALEKVKWPCPSAPPLPYLISYIGVRAYKHEFSVAFLLRRFTPKAEWKTNVYVCIYVV